MGFTGVAMITARAVTNSIGHTVNGYPLHDTRGATEANYVESRSTGTHVFHDEWLFKTWHKDQLLADLLSDDRGFLPEIAHLLITEREVSPGTLVNVRSYKPPRKARVYEIRFDGRRYCYAGGRVYGRVL